MDTSPSIFCDECGAALRSQNERCPVCLHDPHQIVQLPPLVLAPTGLKPITPPCKSRTAQRRLAQRYTILKEIGTGGFGVVYVARDREQRNRLVAIKQINLQNLRPQEIIEVTDSYNREVSLLSGLKHPHLPRIYDNFTDRDHWYIVMDYIEGETLDTRLLRQGALSIKQTVKIGITLCDVLQYLHQ